MRMQEPEQWPSSEAPGTTGQEYGTYRAETGQNAFEQKIFPQESRFSVLNVLIIVFSAIGFFALFSYASYNGTLYLLIGGWYIWVVPSIAQLLFVTIFVLSVIAAVRRAARRSRFR